MRRPKVNGRSLLWSVLFFEADSINWTQSSLIQRISLASFLFALAIYFSAFWALKFQVVAMPILHLHRFWGTLVLTFTQQIYFSTQPSPEPPCFIFTFVSQWCNVFSVWATKTMVFHWVCSWKLIVDNRYLKSNQISFFWYKSTLYIPERMLIKIQLSNIPTTQENEYTLRRKYNQQMSTTRWHTGAQVTYKEFETLIRSMLHDIKGDVSKYIWIKYLIWNLNISRKGSGNII